MRNKDTVNHFLFTLFGFKKAKHKAHIVFIILIHLAGWCLLFLLPVLLYPVRVNDNRFIVRELIDKSVLVLLFYVNYYVLIPRFFQAKKYVAYGSVVMVLFSLYLLQHIYVRANYFPRPGGPFQFVQFATNRPGARDSVPFVTRVRADALMGNMMIETDSLPSLPFGGGFQVTDSVRGPGFRIREAGLFGIPKGVWAMSLNNAISSFALLLLIGGFIRLAYSFVKNQNEKKILENANLNAEVNFLKSQINPHFLFNTLNGIYSQAHSRSEKTEYSILKLSDLLRYVLYDSGDDKVELAKDIQYLNNYIDLQKIRISKKVNINYEVKGEATGKQIAPLLLITFIENAFKHGVSYSKPSTIDIKISIFEKILTLVACNPVIESNSFASGGLGLKNVGRRLELLYPGKYWLDIIHNDHLHIVNLKINLGD